MSRRVLSGMTRSNQREWHLTLRGSYYGLATYVVLIRSGAGAEGASIGSSPAA